jgi:ubiquinone/menaquinone biosynthesis C-methylase UbiE
MTEEDREIQEERIFWFDVQEVTVADVDAEGYILDIGGGGEGIIGRLKGEQVIAVDPSRRELEEAPPGPLKVVMDARDLQFLDETFVTATSFFTLMYIKGFEHQRVFEEVFRVLKPGGRFLIWDVELPPRLDQQKDVAAFPIIVKLPNETVSTGYGAPWPDAEQDVGYYVALVRRVGFEVVEKWEEGRVFCLGLRKPAS